MIFQYADNEYLHYVHADFHSDNILQNENISENMQSYISDLGLSKKIDKNNLNNIYRIIPYVVPEVLLGQKLTRAADIYSFRIIMSEMSTRQRPFDGDEFDIILAIKICKGSHPEFAPETPNCYIELVKQCMDSDSKKQPKTYDLYEKIEDWLNKLNSSDDNEIKRQFSDADKVIKILLIPKHPDEMYTSKLIST